MEILDGLHAAGNTILLVTHEEEMARHAQRVIRLQGRHDRERHAQRRAGRRQSAGQEEPAA